ncbi:MAG: hypothetical protein IKX81_00920 [Firmicutes bacterium]|nr:hypothetical protein [Bacillota bacterium]
MTPYERIKRSILNGTVSHAYIFEGSRLSGREDAALSFLRALSGRTDLENNPDFYEVSAEQSKGRTVKSIKDQDMEELQARLAMKPQGDRNLALIRDADTMTVRAQNRFLKTLEEPQKGTVIILLSENTENLLETIRSRCVIYRFYDGRKSDTVSFDDMNGLLEKVIRRGSFHEIRQAVSKEIRGREDAMCFLDLLENKLRNIMVGEDADSQYMNRQSAIKAIELTEQTARDIRGNAVPTYAVKALALKIQENSKW